MNLEYIKLGFLGVANSFFFLLMGCENFFIEYTRLGVRELEIDLAKQMCPGGQMTNRTSCRCTLIIDSVFHEIKFKTLIPVLFQMEHSIIQKCRVVIL